MADNRRPTPEHKAFENQTIGSILFFAPNLGTGEETDIKKIGPTREQRLFQNLFTLIPGHKHGLNFMFHNAVVIKREREQLYIAHITEKDNILGYVQETLKEQIERDNDRAFISFSPDGISLYEKVVRYFGLEFCQYNHLSPDNIEKALGEQIGKACDSHVHPELTEIEWTYSAGIAATFNWVQLNENREVHVSHLKTQDKSSVCSEFGVKALKIGAINFFEILYKLAQTQMKEHRIKSAGNVDPSVSWDHLQIKANLIPGYIHLKSNATPKEFYHCLHENIDYRMSAYLGKNPIERVVNLLKLILNNPAQIQETESEEISRYSCIDILDEFCYNHMKAKNNTMNESQQLATLFEVISATAIKELHPKIREKIIEVAHGATIEMPHLKKPSKS